MRGSHHRRNADIRRRASHDRGDVAKIGGIDGDNAAGTSASGEFVPTTFLEAIDISDLVKRQRSLRRSMWGLRILSALLWHPRMDRRDLLRLQMPPVQLHVAHKILRQAAHHDVMIGWAQANLRRIAG